LRAPDKVLKGSGVSSHDPFPSVSPRSVDCFRSRVLPADTSANTASYSLHRPQNMRRRPGELLAILATISSITSSQTSRYSDYPLDLRLRMLFEALRDQGDHGTPLCVKDVTGERVHLRAQPLEVFVQRAKLVVRTGIHTPAPLPALKARQAPPHQLRPPP
jgi:hypothetical protein